MPGRPRLLALDGPYDVPAFTEPKMDRNHYLEVAKALYSVTGELIGQRLSAASTPTW